MPFNWFKYLDLAKTLSENEGQESHRSSISRSYYSLYNVLLQYVKYFPARTNHHRELIDIFQDTDRWLEFTENFLGVADSDIVYIGTELEDIRDLRNKCDYNSTIEISKKQAEKVYERVNLIFEIIEDAQEEDIDLP